MLRKLKLQQHDISTAVPFTDPKQYVGIIFPVDIEEFKRKIEDQYFVPYKLDTPGYVLKSLVKAIDAIGIDRTLMLEKARQQAEVHYLSSWSKGIIKIKDETAEPMSEKVKLALKEIKITKQIEKEMEKQALKKLKKKKQSKSPVYDDWVAQEEYVRKYPWLMPHTFVRDPIKSGGTLAQIKCVKCGASREIHLSDVWQVKTCIKCHFGKNYGKTKPKARKMGK